MHCGQSQVNHSTYTSDLPPLLMQLIHIAFLLQWHYQQVRSFLCHSYTTIDHCKSASVVDVSSRWWRLTYSEAMQGLFSTQWVHTHTWPPSSQSIYTIIIVTKTIILSLMCAHAWWLCIFTWACCYLCMNCLAEIYTQYKLFDTCTCRILLLAVLLK